jgi:uncharacterized damage-inducible protein DinB
VPRLAPDLAILLDALDRAFDTRSWHGPGLRGLIRGVSPRQALWRPGAGRHSIWELVLHTAYWKYAVTRRLTGASIGGFQRRPSNWPGAPTRPDVSRWREDVALLESEHRRLRTVVESLDPRRLSRRLGRSWTVAQTVEGVAAHDLYHAGQIGLIKRMAP